MPRRTRKDHINNLILTLFNIATLAIAGFLLEFEVAKLRRPEVGWPNTPSGAAWAVAGTMIVSSILVLAILALIYKKDLYNRPYLWWITGFNLLVGLIMIGIFSRGIGVGTLINFVLFP